MPSRTPKDDKSIVEIPELEPLTITFRLLGTTPLIMNRQSEKAKRMLLLPEPRKNKAQREQTLKHDPIEEYRASVYRNRDAHRPALLHCPEGAFKKLVAQTALDIPGATKAQIGRLVSLRSAQIDVFGIPHVFTRMVRQAGPSRTPDVRTRAILPEWAVEVTFGFINGMITPTSIANLVSAGGLICGIGDGRTEKGALDYGGFRIVPEDDPDWHRVVAEGGRDAQQAALEYPIFYDDETRDLIEWFDAEIQRRRKQPDIAVAARPRKSATSNEGVAQ